MSDSLQSHGLQSARLLCPCNSPGKNTWVGSHSLLQGIFLTQGSNPGLLHRGQILLQSQPLGKPLSSWGRGGGFPGIGPLPTFWPLMFITIVAAGLWLLWAILKIKGKCKLSPPSWTWLFLISLCHVLLLKVVPCPFPVSVILIYVKKECLKMCISKLSSSDRLPHLNNTLSYMASAISHFKFLKWKQSFHSIYGTNLNFWRGNPSEMILLPFSHSF